MPGIGMSEQDKARRVPGIEFKETGSGRDACVSGMKIWQLIQTWRESGERLSALREAHPHLNDANLRTVFAYYHAFPEEIDDLIARNESFDIEEFWQRYPFTRPPWRRRSAGAHEETAPGLPQEGAEGRVLVTRDYQSYGQLTVQFFAKGLPHAGVLFLSPQLCRQGTAATAEAIARFANAHDAMPPYTVEWLEPLSEQDTIGSDEGRS